MSLKEKAVMLAMIGLGMGSSACLLISALAGTLSAGDGGLHIMDPAFVEKLGVNPLTAFVVYMAVSGAYGAAVMGAAIVYDFETWSILRATATHFVIAAGLCLVTADFLCWFTVADLARYPVMVVVWVAAYVLIWLGNFLAYKIELGAINRELVQMKEEERKRADE